MPIEWVPALLKAIENSTVRDGNLRFIDGVKGWNSDKMDELRPEVENEIDYDNIPGPVYQLRMEFSEIRFRNLGLFEFMVWSRVAL